MQHGYTVLHKGWNGPTLSGSIGDKMHKILNAKLWQSIRMPFATAEWKRMDVDAAMETLLGEEVSLGIRSYWVQFGVW